MVIVWPKGLPVLVSIAILIAIGLLREFSRTVAAIVATMLLNIPLALWIVSAADGGNRPLCSNSQTRCCSG